MHDRLRQIRRELGKTQKEMGPLVGSHERSWQGYERGENLPGAEVLAGLVRLGFNANWILAGVGAMRIGEGSPAAAGSGAGGDPLAGVVIPDVPALIQPVIEAVVEVMTSDDAGTKLALMQNALTFQRTVRNERRLTALERDFAQVKGAVGAPATEPKERLDQARGGDPPAETDFKKAAGS